MRIAIVTAYCGEDRATIERCMASVRSQTVPVDHILVADGRPQDWITGSCARHIVLDRPHGDFGDTPRMVGLLLAIREGYEAAQFLDADNVAYPRDAAVGEEQLRGSGAHLVVLKRRFLRRDGSPLEFSSMDEAALTHIDTNCYFFARAAFPTAMKWALIPRELSFMADRVFRSIVSKAGHPVAVAPEPTVGYTCMWASVYRAAGEEPPPGCRDLSTARMNAAAWWCELDEGRRDEIQQALGVRISLMQP